MSSRGLIDLRPGRHPRRPSPGQAALFATRSPQAPKRPMPLRARRRRTRAAILFGVLAAFAALVYAVHYVSYLPQFSIQSVTVTGTKDVSPKLVADYVETILEDGSYHFLSRKNILLYPRAVIERAVAGYFPRIASASVSRPSFASNELRIAVVEREPFALWCADTQCYGMDGGGFIFAPAATTSTTASQYVFQGGLPAQAGISPIGQTFIPARLPGVLALLTQLGQAGFTVRGAAIGNDTDFLVTLVDGYFLKASFGENADTLVKNLRLVLSSGVLQGKEAGLEYVDLRFGDRVYYKLLGQTEATSTPQ